MMAYKLRKGEIVRALTDAGVTVDPNLTLVQLRPLYNQKFGHLPAEQQPGPTILANRNTDEPNVDEIDVGDTDATAVTAATTLNSGTQQQQQQQPLISAGTSGTANGQQQSIDLNIQQQMQNANALGNVDANGSGGIDEQIEILRRKIELQKLMAELNQVQQRRFEYSHFEGMVQQFTGDDAYDVKKWFRDLERALAMFNCSENEKLMAAMRKIGGTAATFMRSWDVVSFGDFKQKIQDYFGRTYSMHEIYQQLRERKIMAGESIKHYVAVMLEIAQRAPVPELNIVEAIIDGLQDRSSNISLLFGATTTDQLQKLIQRYEKRRGMIPTPARPVLAPATQSGATPKTYRQQWQAAQTHTTVTATTTGTAVANIGLVNEADENWDEPPAADEQLTTGQTAEVRRLASQL